MVELCKNVLFTSFHVPLLLSMSRKSSHQILMGAYWLPRRYYGGTTQLTIAYVSVYGGMKRHCTLVYHVIHG